MTLGFNTPHRNLSVGTGNGPACLQEKYEVLKDIGDGSFGSVALARVRGAGAHIAKRGTLVAVKTMKKTFDSFAPCLELREIIFLRTLPPHPHLVPALDIFLDPLSKKLHIAMEHMDLNLYQLIKGREGKRLENTMVKSILYQILSGLEHIHQNSFFHRDIKPENILVTLQHRDDLGSTFKRYSQIVRDSTTHVSTIQHYSVKIADFGLARETESLTPYTTYVSTRWYRAPEVLLRAGEYSAPVDMWAVGAMAVEIALLKPLFPGSNEVDQVWRVCEIMGSPGNWVSKHGDVKVGGGPWKQGAKLAQKLGFTFPKMAPHTIDEFLPAAEFPHELCHFITWCLAWDPQRRPTATQSLQHNYFVDAFDPLRPKSATSSRMLARKPHEVDAAVPLDASELAQTAGARSTSWFRRSLVVKESTTNMQQPYIQQQAQQQQQPQQQQQQITRPDPANMSPVRVEPSVQIAVSKTRPPATKRATWAIGSSQYGAPMPFLPNIKPVSPIPNTVHAQALESFSPNKADSAATLTRQLSMLSQSKTNKSDSHHYATERNLGTKDSRANLASPTQTKEGFLSHFKKRTRRWSGKPGMPTTPRDDDIEANGAGLATWHAPGQCMAHNLQSAMIPPQINTDFGEIDNALRNIQYRMSPTKVSPIKTLNHQASTPMLRRQTSQLLNQGDQSQAMVSPLRLGSAASSLRANQRAMQRPGFFTQRRRAPSNQVDNIANVDQALGSVAEAVARQDQQRRQYSPERHVSGVVRRTSRPNLRASASTMGLRNGPYPTPSPSTRHESDGYADWSKPMDIRTNQSRTGHPFPTPPYDESALAARYDDPWAAAAAVAIAEAGQVWR